MLRRYPGKCFMLSVITIVLCCIVMVGTTFALFTSAPEPERNIISTGTLSVSFTHRNAAMASRDIDEESVEGSTDLFPLAEWEPGVTVWEKFRVKNEGNIPIRYKLSFTVKAPADAATLLTDALSVAFVEDPADVLAEDFDGYVPFSDAIQLSEAMEIDAEKSFYVVMHWEPSDGDDTFNRQVNDPLLYTEIGVRLIAVQANVLLHD